MAQLFRFCSREGNLARRLFPAICLAHKKAIEEFAKAPSALIDFYSGQKNIEMPEILSQR